jgi:hypothetical protein
MKLFYLILVLLHAPPLFAQEKKLQRNNLGHIEISEVVQLDSFPAVQLYFNARLFLNSMYQHNNETIQLWDDKSKSVATKASFPVTITNRRGDEIKARASFALAIQSKENLYKYTIDDFYFAYTEETGVTSYASFNDRLGVGMSPKQWQLVEAQTEDFLLRFIPDLKEQMRQKEILCKELLHAKKKEKKK